MSIKNILFIMCDQLRWDYLSCYGHPHLQTPHIDKLASQGVMFDRAYVQSPLCCPSRASFYTGRYMSSHGASVNFASLRPDELGIGDYLKPLGVRTGLAGKTHSFPDIKGMARLSIELESPLGKHLANIGFEPFWRDDGLHPNDQRSENIAYNRYLREVGYEAQNPWNQFANGTIDENGEWLNGWFLKAGDYPADIEDAHSETPYTTRQGMAFIEDAGDNPWCLHLSYIKPHWPYIAPPPYDSMYDETHFLPRIATEEEMDEPHPVFEAFTQIQVSRAFQRPEARAAVMKAYMGLIKQIDDQIGTLMTFLESRNQLANTLIVFTSDHGDYLGDHWMGEKSWFHEPSVRVPLIIVDPTQAGDTTRGTRCDELVEAIDLVPTFVDYLGGEIPKHRLEGRSLRPLLQSSTPPTDWRTFAVSETDFADRGVKYILDIPHSECNAVMICTKQWKYIHVDNYRPILFDLENDPDEMKDLGADEAYTAVIHQMQQHLITFFLRRKSRITLPDAAIDNLVGGVNREKRGIYIGFYEEKDLPEEVRNAKQNKR
ncbi:MAG: sulfatase-like hydrolase/transferase [Chloroflexota bacterium]